MTLTQIQKVLTDRGLSMNAWLTLDGEFHFISLNNDRTIFIKPQALQFYFSTDEYILIRYTKGFPVASVNIAPDGYVSVSHEGNSYILKLESGGKIDTTAGLYHDILDINAITGFFYK